ncbi:MAG: PIN domain-containing protein [Saprospiraceae bacterium]|nr:PIN domain-containing protein [Saprospiraceae bacterium]
MKNYLLDTNILLLYLRGDSRMAHINNLYNPFSVDSKPIVSVVTVGEIHSIALQRHWGLSKIADLNRFLNKFLIADINVRPIIDAYAEIDAFSQNKLASNPLGMTARSMGKNDLWIAATAHVLKLPLLTTDKDFHHLKDTYLDLAFIDLMAI